MYDIVVFGKETGFQCVPARPRQRQVQAMASMPKFERTENPNPVEAGGGKQIFVRTLGGKTIELNVVSSASIDDVKKMVLCLHRSMALVCMLWPLS